MLRVTSPPTDPGEGWPRGRLFTLTLSQVPGLLPWALREVQRLAAPGALSLLAHSAQRLLRGVPLTFGGARAVLLSMLLLQLLVRGVAGLLILPAARDTLAWAAYLEGSWLDKQLRGVFRELGRSLRERALLVERARHDLSERHASREAGAAAPVRLQAPDGIVCQAWWQPAPPGGAPQRAVLYLCGNGESAEVRRGPAPCSARS